MVNEHYSNMRNVSLFDFLSSECTRTIPSEVRDLPFGISEIPIEFNLKKAILKKLSFKTPQDGILYGYVKPKELIKKRLNIQSELKNITISEWDNVFVLVFETEKDSETIAFYINQDDVIKLLESCLRPPEQR